MDNLKKFRLIYIYSAQEKLVSFGTLINLRKNRLFMIKIQYKILLSASVNHELIYLLQILRIYWYIFADNKI